jgi:hypothetical protein
LHSLRFEERFFIDFLNTEDAMAEIESSSAWIDELKRLCGVPSTDVGVQWCGQSFCFVPLSSATPGHLSIYVWVGSRSGVTSVDALLQLMWLQLQAVGPVPPVLGFEPDSGQLVIAQCIEWREMPPTQALMLMRFLADLTAEVRELLSGKKKSLAGASAARKRVGMGMQRELPRGCLV